MSLFQGAGVALVSLFDDGGRLLVEETAGLAVRLADDGAAGVLVAGTTGEFWTLDHDERLTLIAAVRSALPADVPVLAGIGAVDADDALRLAEHVGDTGADAALCFVPPGSDPADLFGRVQQRLAGLPLLAYHFPAAGYAELPVADLHGYGVAGIKDSSGDPARLLATARTLDAGVYTGSALLPGLAGALGVAGCLLALGNVAPAAAAAAWAGDQSAQGELAALHAEVVGDVPPRRVKQLAAQRYGTPRFTRAPALRDAW